MGVSGVAYFCQNHGPQPKCSRILGALWGAAALGAAPDRWEAGDLAGLLASVISEWRAVKDARFRETFGDIARDHARESITLVVPRSYRRIVGSGLSALAGRVTRGSVLLLSILGCQVDSHEVHIWRWPEPRVRGKCQASRGERM